MKFLCFLLIFTSTQVLAQKLTKNETESLVWKYLDTYSPNEAEMLRLLYNSPDIFHLGEIDYSLSKEQPLLHWVSSKTEKGVVQSLNTLVHESLHGFTARYAYQLLSEGNLPYEMDENYSAYYLSKEEVYLVKHTIVFSSNRLAKYIPKALRTFRFSPYITPKDNHLGSQVQGIYGLMDEWNAYYHGTKTAYDLFDYYGDKSKKDRSIYLEHVRNLAGTYFAYYEFKYFILKYLEYSKNHVPEVYERLLNNIELRKAYVAINNGFEELINQFEDQLDSIQTIVEAENTTTVYRKEGFYFIGRNGVGLFKDEVDALKNELSKSNFRQLDMEFRTFHKTN